MSKTITNGREYLEATLNHTLKQGDKIFVPYIMAGDGGLNQLIPTLKGLSDAGASAIEVGIPFSDPVADGPTIQEAGKRALSQGVSLQAVMELLKTERHHIKAPIIFMTYINPIFKYGIDKFIDDACVAGVDGLIIPDLPFEQQHLITNKLDDVGIAFIQLVSLTSSDERKQQLTQASQGFTYAITVNGITGARKEHSQNLTTHFKQLKHSSNVPVLAGFGISTPEHVKQMSEIADGVIVGSKIIELLQHNDYDLIKRLIKSTQQK
ncbi:tryptophan synthase subunit alpha [Tenuibacillus multivorans]|uniref:Tryptophan synthase alpha chain n=1 Tax=Tenuibacillus multivorans TaxID=237069 RepID=A0A1H0B076_9BACI|nr:tryptophan synthase subunit alpha [Tenuibacillus multivorans]GEL77603.1 tryptophan synthase alpha chain [Tenuibacillus multivorans]SDN38693.1 tryptophan synthase, alpha chain [Tenuibacillus multivorans]